MKKILLITGVALLLTSCESLGMVEYEGVWISKAEKARIVERQHRIFDLGIYDDDNDMSMSVQRPRAR